MFMACDGLCESSYNLRYNCLIEKIVIYCDFELKWNAKII